MPLATAQKGIIVESSASVQGDEMQTRAEV